MTVIDLRAETERRERSIIALAGELRDMFANGDPEDPEPWQPTIVEMVAEAKSAPPEELDFQYRCAVACFVTAPDGGVIDLHADPAPHHRSCLDWSRAYLARIEGDFGVRLLDEPGRPR